MKKILFDFNNLLLSKNPLTGAKLRGLGVGAQISDKCKAILFTSVLVTSG
jgi:hypothetical protein